MCIESSLFMHAMLCRIAVEFEAGGGRMSNIIVESQTGAEPGSLSQDFGEYQTGLRRELDLVKDRTWFNETSVSSFSAMIFTARMQVCASLIKAQFYC
jgi:hypothetical protein